MRLFCSILLFFFTITLLACKKEEATQIVSASSNIINFDATGGMQILNIQTNASSWNITIEPGGEWIELSALQGSGSSSNVQVTASGNPLQTTRTAILNVKAGDALPARVTIQQQSSIYPNYNTNPVAPDRSGMTKDATALAAEMTLGWNLGNTLEATGGETAWGNPAATLELIQLVKQSGFNVIRLPAAWNQYADQTTAKINITWLNRVKQVVQYCIDNDLYVILNIHWDGGWLENNCTPDKKVMVNAKQKAFWEQIATHFRDFDEHLLFAGANEPAVENAEQMEVLLSYHQTFVNAVRSTGGRNAYRTLIVQGPATDIEKTNRLMNTLPEDNVARRLMVEVHYYTPWNFAGLTTDESWGNQFYYWGNGNHSVTDPSRNPTWGEEATVDADFKLMKQKFIDQNIPVIMGEYGALRRTNLTGEALALHLQSRNYYLNYVTKQAVAHQMIPVYWDNGVFENSVTFGLINRQNNTVADPGALNAMLAGVQP